MADLERHAFKRDKRFILRLVLVMLIGAVGGAFIFVKMTSFRAGACAARFMDGEESPRKGRENGP